LQWVTKLGVLAQVKDLGACWWDWWDNPADQAVAAETFATVAFRGTADVDVNEKDSWEACMNFHVSAHKTVGFPLSWFVFLLDKFCWFLL
jgi:hypothetical protein